MDLVEGQGPVEQFVAAGLDPSFHDRVHPGHADVAEHDLDAGVGQDGVEQGRVLAVPVADQVLDLASGVLEAMTKFRAAWVTQAEVGWGVTTRISASLSRWLIGISHSGASALVTPR
jgi:hypothetical protein